MMAFRILHVALAVLALFCAAGEAWAQPRDPAAQQAASDDGTAFAKDARTVAAALPDQPVDPAKVPGYQPAPQNLTSLYGGDAAALSSAAGRHTNDEAFQTMRSADTNRARVDPASLKDLLDDAEAINDTALGVDTGSSASGTQGQCKEVTRPAAQVYYDATCDVGDTITSTDPVLQYACPAGWSLSGKTCSFTQTRPASVSYSCPNGGNLQATSCVVSQPAGIAGYTCPAGFVLAGTNCTRTLAEVATVSGYSCPADFALQGTLCLRTLQQSATPVYSCPAGYNLIGTMCNSTTTYQGSASYSCPGDFVLSGSTCNQTLNEPAELHLTCPSGYVLSSGVCAMQSTYAAIATTTCPPGWILQAGQCAQAYNYAASTVYTCPSNFYAAGSICYPRIYQCGVPSPGTDYKIVNGQVVCGTPRNWYAGGKCPVANSWFLFEQKLAGTNYCLFRANDPYQCPLDQWTSPDKTCALSYYTVPAAVNYSCPEGGALAGKTCSGTNYTGTTIAYDCPDGGTLEGSTCLVNLAMPPTSTYSCRTGYSLSGTTCSITHTVAANVAYSCPGGGTLEGTTCTINNSQPAEIRYSCPADWVLAGNQCTSTLTQTATPIYTCPIGYDLSGAMCSKSEVQPASPRYACPAGYDLSGSTCTRITPATVTYSCPAGYALSGTTCSQTLTQAANGTLVCPDSAASLEDGKCYVAAARSTCSDLAANPQCKWLRDTCLDETQTGPCRITEKTYSCPAPGDQGPPDKEFICSGDLYCLGGSCQQIEREASNELKDVLVALGAIDQAHQEFDPDNLNLFTGNRETCHQPIFGMVNCCAGKVSGLLSGGSAVTAWAALGSGGVTAIAGIATQFLTVFMCSNAEKQLDVKDRLGLCHFVGSYCSSSFLGVCSTKRKTYCCFESKLTRILQEQGRPQINKPWAAPREETCQGFTIDEFSRLDLSQMDFSEIYSEFLEAAKLPDEARMASDIQAKIRNYYQQNGAN